MRIRAYQDIYLSNAQSMLGDVFDYAVNICKIPGDRFVKLFAASSICRRMENGESACLAGKSGIEMLVEILTETTGEETDIRPQERFTRSREYWVGWAIAYYQWCSVRKYSDIFKAVTFIELQKMYETLHEADITKFTDIMDERMHAYYSDTNLKRLRMICGCTQAELARRSGVSLRCIQMYEQRNKNINKAGLETVFRLSRALGCTMEDLMEK